MSQVPPEASGTEGPGDGATLEQVLEELESAVRRLADQSAPLERMVSDWERAQTLARDAERRLDEIEESLRGDVPSGPPHGCPTVGE